MLHSLKWTFELNALWLELAPFLTNFLQEVLQQKEAEIYAKSWAHKARPEQREPTHQHWNTWLILAGRGFGKTRTGAETVWSWIQLLPWPFCITIKETASEAFWSNPD